MSKVIVEKQEFGKGKEGQIRNPGIYLFQSKCLIAGKENKACMALLRQRQ